MEGQQVFVLKFQTDDPQPKFEFHETLCRNRQGPLRVELPIHEHQHLHRNYLLVKILAFEPTTKRKLFRSTGDALIFQSHDNDILAARLVPNNISGFEIAAH